VAAHWNQSRGVMDSGICRDRSRARSQRRKRRGIDGSAMRLFARLIREPLIQFLLIGTAVFILYARTGGELPPPRDRIIVTSGRVQQLAEVFAKTWQRPPTAQELHGLVNAYIKEEVYYREALKLGLDRDDTLIRRRMQQKMEFLTEPGDDVLSPTDAQLQDFLAANRSEFRVEPRIAFQQIFINPERSEEPAALRAEQVLSSARASPAGADVRSLGDPTLLPHEMPLSAVGIIDRNFGEDFGKKLTTVPKGEWSGPLESPFGLHLVRITDRRSGYDPPLEQIRKAVELKWRTDKRDAFVQAEYKRLRDKYEVVLPAGDTPGEAARLKTK
jgi:hypothetical protein